ncbi:MAG: hypothetical protein LIO92_04785 [Clostridiales bacterium]|nr:hypothetical protein [Clostridiales bacterium]
MVGFADACKLPPEAESEAPKGKMYRIACKTWFTSMGATMPLSFKFEDDTGELQTVSHLTIQYSEDKNYAGIPSKEYGCEAIIGGLLRSFRLIFYMEACMWVMVI